MLSVEIPKFSRTYHVPCYSPHSSDSIITHQVIINKGSSSSIQVHSSILPIERKSTQTSISLPIMCFSRYSVTRKWSVGSSIWLMSPSTPMSLRKRTVASSGVQPVTAEGTSCCFGEVSIGKSPAEATGSALLATLAVDLPSVCSPNAPPTNVTALSGPDAVAPVEDAPSDSTKEVLGAAPGGCSMSARRPEQNSLVGKSLSTNFSYARQ